MAHTIYRSCSLCEACCGLAFEVESDRMVAVRPDHDDVFSHGYVCPKGIAMTDVHNGPDRLRMPVRRQRGGGFARIRRKEIYHATTEAEL